MSSSTENLIKLDVTNENWREDVLKEIEEILISNGPVINDGKPRPGDFRAKKFLMLILLGHEMF